MIRVTRDGLLIHGGTGITLGGWTRTADGCWEVWGGRRHLNSLGLFGTRAAMVRWVERNCRDEWEMVAPLPARPLRRTL